MADLVTHTCAVWLPALLARWRHAGAITLGAALPDVGGRVVPLALDLVDRVLLPVPEVVLWAWPALHEPLGAGAVAYLVSLAWPLDERRAALGALWAGVASHTLLDLLQDHHGVGYLVAAPLSTRRVELGWMSSEATVAVAWPLLGVTLGVAAWRALASPITRASGGTPRGR